MKYRIKISRDIMSYRTLATVETPTGRVWTYRTLDPYPGTLDEILSHFMDKIEKSFGFGATVKIHLGFLGTTVRVEGPRTVMMYRSDKHDPEISKIVDKIEEMMLTWR